MSAIEESALVGALIVRRAAKRLAHLLPGVTFHNASERHIVETALNLAAAGLEDDPEYAVHIANALRFDKRSTAPLFAALEAFETMADQTDETLEAFALRLVRGPSHGPLRDVDYAEAEPEEETEQPTGTE